ncbi:hypothetical protein ACFR9U_06755 [Halorientalis brevis]|uniref:Uncharacterized protein n=1 Tax=Halorientalis brevis TaxID=1126241 RepID=A0ABD6CBV2_9EURY|nr:hypothetical protein [Halorientalis brevis]
MTNRPRPDEIDPMVPDMSNKMLRADGGIVAVAESSGRSRYHRDEADAPLVPDLS